MALHGAVLRIQRNAEEGNSVNFLDCRDCNFSGIDQNCWLTICLKTCKTKYDTADMLLLGTVAKDPRSIFSNLKFRCRFLKIHFQTHLLAGIWSNSKQQRSMCNLIAYHCSLLDFKLYRNLIAQFDPI